MLIDIVLLIVGFIVLIKGADLFVDGAKDLALNFNVSKLLVGLTIVSFGTSAPEFAVSIQSLIAGSGELVLGNVIGSNISNILLILGVSAIVHPLVVKNNTVKKELPITLLITTLFLVLITDSGFDQGIVINSLTRSDGIVIVLFFSIFIYYLFSIMRNKIDKDKPDEPEEKRMSIKKSIAFSLVGITSIIIGSNFAVSSATGIAEFLGISERMIALTIVAIGTSLPELVTSIVATKKGEYDIAIGNVVGSNIFNIGMVIGIPVIIFGGISNIAFSAVDLLVLFGSALLLFLFAAKDYRLTRKEGTIFVICFIAYYMYIIFGG